MRDPVAEIQPLGSGAEVDAAEFVAKMRDLISRREESVSDDTETRASASESIAQEPTQETAQEQ